MAAPLQNDGRASIELDLSESERRENICRRDGRRRSRTWSGAGPTAQAGRGRKIELTQQLELASAAGPACSSAPTEWAPHPQGAGRGGERERRCTGGDVRVICSGRICIIISSIGRAPVRSGLWGK